MAVANKEDLSNAPVMGLTRGTVASGGSPGLVPIPDPSELTSRAVAELKSGLTTLFGQRFEFIDRQLAQLQAQQDARPAYVTKELDQLQELVAEKFKGVADNFLGRDTALAAALTAAARSASKSEAAATKLIDGISDTIIALTKNFDDKIEAVKALISANTKAVDDKVDDLRARVGAAENQKVGSKENWGALSAIIAGVVGVTIIAGFVITQTRPAAPIVIERPAASTP